MAWKALQIQIILQHPGSVTTKTVGYDDNRMIFIPIRQYPDRMQLSISIVAMESTVLLAEVHSTTYNTRLIDQRIVVSHTD